MISINRTCTKQRQWQMQCPVYDTTKFWIISLKNYIFQNFWRQTNHLESFCNFNRHFQYTTGFWKSSTLPTKVSLKLNCATKSYLPKMDWCLSVFVVTATDILLICLFVNKEGSFHQSFIFYICIFFSAHIVPTDGLKALSKKESLMKMQSI